jgi:hypothetical protein
MLCLQTPGHEENQLHIPEHLWIAKDDSCCMHLVPSVLPKFLDCFLLCRWRCQVGILLASCRLVLQEDELIRVLEIPQLNPHVHQDCTHSTPPLDVELCAGEP